jgi:hypothetical protein
MNESVGAVPPRAIAPGDVVAVFFEPLGEWDDIAAARAELGGRGGDVSEVKHYEDGVQKNGPGGPWNSFVFFSDPDGNGWTVQERPSWTA